MNLFEEEEFSAPKSGGVVIVKDGKMVRGEESFRPCIGDAEGGKAFAASKKAKSFQVDLTEGKHGKMTHVMMCFSCPYCAVRYTGKGVAVGHQSAVQAAFEKLGFATLPKRKGELECECGATYHRLVRKGKDGLLAFIPNTVGQANL